ncbi:MAG: exodeoxyribonuclease III [Gammaproteobacteria bacterium]|nr:exodeoxyribonuclease III [Gammaproteobacteria bacterium]
MTFTIATWNVNSLRVRLPHVIEWLNSNDIDVLAIQETKVPDADFPISAINQAGYQVVFSGQKTYNGVAILSRTPILETTTDILDFADPQRRVLAVTINNLRVINLYVPNGQTPLSDKYHYKLEWLKKTQTFIADQLKIYEHVIVLGDFNIAPEDRDVHDPISWEGSVLVSPAERAALQEITALGLKDCFRLHPQPEKSFSWWDYRMNAFKRNMGLRIDHILASHSLSSYCESCSIDKTPKTWQRSSDHTPVIAKFLNIT